MKYLLVMGCNSRLSEAFFLRHDYPRLGRTVRDQFDSQIHISYLYRQKLQMDVSARILLYLFNGTLQILAIRITVEKGNQSSLPKTFICVVAILFETINVTCCDTCILNSLWLRLASKPSCRDVTDHKARGRGKFCIKLCKWFTSLRHKTTFSLKSYQDYVYFPKVIRQKKQNLGFLN